MSADNKNCLNYVKIILPVCPVHIVVIADNVSTMHVHRCAYNRAVSVSVL